MPVLLYKTIQVYNFAALNLFGRSLPFISLAVLYLTLLTFVTAANTLVDFVPSAFATAAGEGQAGPPIGLVSRGTIDSLITTPSTKWIATGNWSMNVNNGSLQSFEANMTWLNSTGTAAHTHEFLNFRVPPGKVISIQQPGNNIFLNGVMDVGTNNRIVWRDVPSNISINAKNTIIISVDDNATNRHFAGQPVLGVVKTFVICSDIPEPNMEVLPPCTSNVQRSSEGVNNNSPITPSSLSSTSAAPSAEVLDNITTSDLTYENATLGLKLNYPSNWVVRQGGTVNPNLSIAAILFPLNDNSSAFTIGIQDLKDENGIATIMDYANSTIARYRQEVNNFQPALFNTNGTLSGNPAYEIDGSYTDPISQGREFFELGTLLNNNKVYVFQFDSPKPLSSSYLPTVTRIIQSVKINTTTTDNDPRASKGTVTKSSISTEGPCRNLTINQVNASGFERDPKDYNPPRHAVDGDSNTWWSNKKVPSWLQVGFTEPIRICSVDISWNKGEERTYDFTLSTSSDGQIYTDIYTGKSKGISSLSESYDLGNSIPNTKFLKITLTGSSSKAGWVGIKELRVIGH